MELLNKLYIKDEDMVARRIAGETIIIPVKNRVGDLSSIYTLNDVGSLVWQLIDGQREVSQIISVISDEYEVSEDEARRDVLELFGALEEAGLVRAVGGSKA